MTVLPSLDRLRRLLAYLDTDPSNLALRKDAIHAAFACEQWGKADELIVIGLDQAPEDPGMLGVSAISHLRAHRFEAAIEAFVRARQSGLDSPSLRHDLAYAYFMLGQHRKSLDELEAPEVLQSVPHARLLAARCHHHLGQIDEAIEDCREQLVLDPGHPETCGILGLLMHERRHPEEARAFAEVALEHAPWQLEALLTMASLTTDAGDFEGARSNFKSLLQMHPSCGRGWLGLALVEMMTSQLDAGRVSIEIAARYMPDHLGTWHVLAWLHVMRGDVGAAHKAFEHALSLDRNFAESHGGMAVVAALQGREIQANEMVRRALRLNPNVMSAQYARVLLLNASGQHDEARTVVEEFMQRPVADSDVQYRHLVSAQIASISQRVGHAGKTLH